MSISDYLHPIIDLISTHTISSIQITPTAPDIGINIEVPLAIAEAGSRCGYIVPNQTMVTALSEYQQAIQSPDAITYLTEEMAIGEILSSFTDGAVVKGITSWDVLIFDSPVNSNRIMRLWTQILEAQLEIPRLVLFNSDDFPSITIPYVPSPTPVLYDHTDYNIKQSSGPLYTKIAQFITTIFDQTDEGDILVYVPGTEEGDAIMNASDDPRVVPAYGEITSDDIGAIYTEDRKAIIVTADTESVVVNEVAYVIDSMVQYQPIHAPSGGVRFAPYYISKTVADHRKNRATVVTYRMCTQTKYNTFPDQTTDPFENVYPKIIQILKAGLDPTEWCCDKVTSKKEITSAVELLQQIGMVDSELKVTTMGDFYSRFQFSPRNAALLWNWINFDGYHFGPEIIQQSLDLGFDYSEMEISDTYTSVVPSDFEHLDSMFDSLNIHPTQILDLTAGVGGMIVYLANRYYESTIVGVESDLKQAQILRRNMEQMGNILNQDPIPELLAIHSEDYINTPRSADLIYLDASRIDDVLSVIEAISATTIIIKLDTDITTVPGTVYETDIGRFLIISSDQTLPETTLIEPQVDLVPATYPIFPGVVLTSVIDSYGPSYFYIPRRNRGQTVKDYKTYVQKYVQDHFDKYRGYSDVETALNVWNDMMQAEDVPTWAKQNRINHRKIQEAVMIVDRTVDLLTQSGYDIIPGLFTSTNVIRAAQPFIAAVYADTILTRSRNITYRDTEGNTFLLDPLRSVNQMVHQPPIHVVPLNTGVIPGGGRRIHFGIDIQPEAELTDESQDNLYAAFDLLDKLEPGTALIPKIKF